MADASDDPLGAEDKVLDQGYVDDGVSEAEKYANYNDNALNARGQRTYGKEWKKMSEAEKKYARDHFRHGEHITEE